MKNICVRLSKTPKYKQFPPAHIEDDKAQKAKADKGSYSTLSKKEKKRMQKQF